MLRRKEDMKEWRKSAEVESNENSVKKEDVIVGQKAPDGLPYDDLPDLPKDFPVAKPKRKSTKKPVAKVKKEESKEAEG